MLIILIILMQNIQNWYGVSWSWVSGRGRPASSCQAAPGSPGLASGVGRNWTQECTDWNLDQNNRQDKEQGLLQKAAMDEENKTLVIP